MFKLGNDVLRNFVRSSLLLVFVLPSEVRPLVFVLPSEGRSSVFVFPLVEPKASLLRENSNQRPFFLRENSFVTKDQRENSNQRRKDIVQITKIFLICKPPPCKN